MELENGSSPFHRIVDLCKPFVAACGAFRFWSSRKDVLNRMWGRFPAKLHITDGGNLMEAQFWIFCMCIDDGLPDRRRESTLILLWEIWWWHWWKQTGHASLIKEIGLVID